MSQTAIEKRIDDEDLAAIASMDDAIALLSGMGVAVREVGDLIGDGFSLEDKSALVNVAFVIVSFSFAKGEYGEDFAVVRAVTADNRKIVFTDGSTGVREQVRRLGTKGINPNAAGVLVKRGLTVSEYEYTDDKGKVTPAKTYYLTF